MFSCLSRPRNCSRIEVKLLIPRLDEGRLLLVAGTRMGTLLGMDFLTAATGMGEKCSGEALVNDNVEVQ